MRPVKIGDIRGRERHFDLEKQGFQFCRAPTVGEDFENPETIKNEVYQETEKLVKEV